MTTTERKLGVSIVLSVVSFAIAIGVGLYVYKFLWAALSPEEFSLWFIAFELSQFLLLLDLGFSHKFIASNGKKKTDFFSDRLNELRFVLLGAGGVAVMAFLVVSYFVTGWPESLRISFFLLAGSLLLNLAGYAETSVLRIQLRNNEIYLISIASQLCFMGILLFLPAPEGIRIGVAVIFRSAFVYIAQVVRVKRPYLPKWSMVNHFGGAVVAINLAYFILFMLDAAILGATVMAATSIAAILALRKYFDLLRAMWDSILPNLYVRFSMGNDSKIYYSAVLACASSYAIAVVFAGPIISIWLPGFLLDSTAFIGLGVSVFAVTLFRMTTLRAFYKNSLNWRAFLVGGVFVKILFSITLVVFNSNISYSYLIQGVILIFLVVFLGAQQKDGALGKPN